MSGEWTAIDTSKPGSNHNPSPTPSLRSIPTIPSDFSPDSSVLGLPDDETEGVETLGPARDTQLRAFNEGKGWVEEKIRVNTMHHSSDDLLAAETESQGVFSSYWNYCRR